MSQFKAGFARIDITPPLGINMAGYFSQRVADGILTPLEANAVAVSDGKNNAVIISVDIIGMPQKLLDHCRQNISKLCGISYEAVFISSTHTHTGPCIGHGRYETNPSYDEMLFSKISDVARIALEDLNPATIEIGRGNVANVSYIRRYRMKDGTIKTNPGVGNPDIVHPIGTPDEELQLVSFKRSDGKEIIVVNFQVHPDVIGGCKISPDFPGVVRNTLERVLPNANCIYINGAQGDTNHYNTSPKPGEITRGIKRSQYMGYAIAGEALKVYTMTRESEPGKVAFGQLTVTAPSNRTSDSDSLIRAKEIIGLHETGQNEKIGKGNTVTLLVAEAYRMIRLENGPDAFQLYVTGISFGDICIIGFPGEPFTEIGCKTKASSPFDMTIISCCANGSEGYFPMHDAFEEGGYEARSSNFKSGIAELLISGAEKLTKQLKV